MAINDVIAKNKAILRSRASRMSVQGVAIAVAAAILATLLVDYSDGYSISWDGMLRAQRENYVLWILDALPMIFAYLGQYSSYVVANEASLMVLQQTQELRERADQMERQAIFAATHDMVTDLPNRALFSDRLEQALNLPQSQLAVFMILVENLKEIHTTLGQASVDLVAKQLATRLGSILDRHDSVARIDDDSFAILLCDCRDAGAAELAARGILKAVEPNFIVNRLKLTLQISVGIALAPTHGDDSDTLLQRAGIAAHSAAKVVANYALYSESMEEHSPRRLTLMGELKRALERDELKLFFQPKIDLAKQQVVGAEALIRWQHADHGFVPPDEFIGMAERTRMIRLLSQWVLEKAFAACARWQAEGQSLMLSINLSTKDLNDPELPDFIAGMIAKTGVRPESIIFEITESSIITDPVRVLIIAERLRSMGFQFSVDDFGTGYSSLAYLKKLPVSELKIDKSFVLDMESSQNDCVIVQATINLAHNLGLKVTAEGIETQSIARLLTEWGCDLGQGYLYAKALQEDEFMNWVRQFRHANSENASLAGAE